MAQPQSFSVDQGETWSISLACRNADGSPMALPSGTIVQFRLGVGPTPLVVAGSILDPVAGTVLFQVSPSAQTGIAAGVYGYVTRVILPNGVTVDQTSGAVTVIPTPEDRDPTVAAMLRPSKPKPKEAQADLPDVERGDEVYFRTPKGAAAGKVLSRGKHGVTLDAEGKRHRVKWEHLHGHKVKVQPSAKVVDQGEDGMLVEDASGRRRFIHDPLKAPAEPLAKAQPSLVLFRPLAKAIKNGPGLHKEDRTDKLGHHQERWVRNGDPAKASPRKQEQNPAVHAPGTRVLFRIGGAQGQGEVVGKPGKDGSHVRDDAGHTHQVAHGDMEPADSGQGGGGKPKGGEGGGEPPEMGPLGHPKLADPEGLAGLESGNEAGAKAAGLHKLFGGDEYGELPVKSSMPHKSWSQVSAKQEEAQSQLIDVLRRAAKAVGAKQVKRFDDEIDQPGSIWGVGPPKTEESARKKAAKKRWDAEDFSRLGDAVRGSMGFDTVDELFKGVDALKSAGVKLAAQPDNKFIQATPAGYRDINLNIELPNGVVGELQLHLKPILKAKRTGHHDYDMTRDIEKKFVEDGVVSPEEHEAWHRHMVKQRQLYGGAFKEALRGTPGEHKSKT